MIGCGLKHPEGLPRDLKLCLCCGLVPCICKGQAYFWTPATIFIETGVVQGTVDVAQLSPTLGNETGFKICYSKD